MARIGIFGGSFNPAHNGHLIMALEAQEQVPLDLVLLVPVHQPPHKGGEALLDSAVRLRLLHLAIQGLPGLQVDDREIRRGGISYSVVTARELASERPGDELFFLIGEDSLSELHRWREIRQLAGLVTFLVAPRPGAEAAAPELANIPGLRFLRVGGTPVGISSTQVRERARAGKPLRGFVPDVVAQVIEEEQLFSSR